MSAYLDHKFPPAVIEEVLGAAPTLLRNWRTRGHLEHIGAAQGGGRWLYSASDLVKIAIVQIFQKGRVDLADAFQFAEFIEVDVLIQIYDLEFDGIATRFTSLFRHQETGAWMAFKVREAVQLYTSAPVTTVLDAWAIAREIPDALKRTVAAPTVNELHEVKANLFSRTGPMTFDRATGRVDVPRADP